MYTLSNIIDRLTLLEKCYRSFSINRTTKQAPYFSLHSNAHIPNSDKSDKTVTKQGTKCKRREEC